MNRLLFWIALLMAVVLSGLVLVGSVISVTPSSDVATRVFSLFAHDATVRQCALAAAVGLIVTACVFFRSPQRT
jgi:hypothetical protein